MNTKTAKPKSATGKGKPAPSGNKAALAKAETAIEDMAAVKSEIARVIFGQEAVVNNCLATILAGGHAVLVGLPGLAKTKLVETLGTVLGLGSHRIQFTPDLMPSDILGSEILQQDDNGKRFFQFTKGPVFTNLLMADEINRASPKTQSALLQAMQEYHVTIAGERYDLPGPFHVLATQNPLEQEGTYPLPEAQLDRFLMQIDVGYPQLDDERRILIETTGSNEAKPSTILKDGVLENMQALVRQMPVGQNVLDAILELVRSLRPKQNPGGKNEHTAYIAWGPGPRAGQSLMLTSRAYALLDGRLSPSIDDIIELAKPVLKHRMQLNFTAQAEKITIDSVIESAVKQL